MSLVMTRAERAQFLLSHVTGVMIVQGGGELFSTPVWYDYEPGGTIGFVINQGARRLSAIDDPGCMVGLTVHDDSGRLPAFVTAFGPVVVNPTLEAEDLARVWPVMCRALGGEDVASRYVNLGSDAYLRGADAPPQSVPGGSRSIPSGGHRVITPRRVSESGRCSARPAETNRGAPPGRGLTTVLPAGCRRERDRRRRRCSRIAWTTPITSARTPVTRESNCAMAI